jgi:hypothetical protein
MQLPCFFEPQDAAPTGLAAEAALKARVTAVRTQNFI